MFSRAASLAISDGNVERKISVYCGDLTRIPADHALDILVISAFPNGYMPTPTSLIGGLDRVGVSVGELAAAAEFDLRNVCQFWLSQPLAGNAGDLNVGRIACFESDFRGAPPKLVGSFFRGLFPFLRIDGDATVGMPILATGDQGYDIETMFDAIVDAAAHWMSRGLGIAELKIVVRDPQQANVLGERLSRWARSDWSPVSPSVAEHRVFLSFSSSDRRAASLARETLLRRDDVASVFDYRLEIDGGHSWQSSIDEAITSCSSIVALTSPEYFGSPECQEELAQARLRHKREGGGVLFPVYWRSGPPDSLLWLQLIQASDCREADEQRLVDAVMRMKLH